MSLHLKRRYPIITVPRAIALTEVTPLEQTFVNLEATFTATAQSLLSENAGRAGIYMYCATVAKTCATRMHGNGDPQLFDLSWAVHNISDIVEEPFRCLEHLLFEQIPRRVEKSPTMTADELADRIFTFVSNCLDEYHYATLAKANHDLGIENHTELEKDKLYPWRERLGRRYIGPTEVIGYSYRVTAALCERYHMPIPENRGRYNYAPFPYSLVE